MDRRDQDLARALEFLTPAAEKKKRARAFRADRQLQRLVADLAAARTAAAMTQDDAVAKIRP
jgi:hypothetical protein